MKTVGIPYLGSKRALVQTILHIIQNECVGAKKVLDVMTGTTRVAQAFLASGYDVLTSDTSEASACFAAAFLERPQAVEEVTDSLNALASDENGWLTETYCDARAGTDPSRPIRVFQPHNGRKADAIREAIIGHPHEKALVGLLILALSRVDNSVGHHQAYLKNWCARSHRDLLLEIPICPAKIGTYLGHVVGDALSIDYPEADLAYVDPPYSQHSYKTYFHIWDSIALWDKPGVGLSTNRRLDRVGGGSGLKSPWNSKETAGEAFDTLFCRLPVKYVLVSYSEDALLSLETLRTIAAKHGDVKVFTYDHKKNIMSKIGNARDQTQPLGTVKEYFVLIKKSQSSVHP